MISTFPVLFIKDFYSITRMEIDIGKTVSASTWRWPCNLDTEIDMVKLT